VTRQEIIEKLEVLAQNGGSIAELNACKALLALPEFSGEEQAKDPFSELDEAAGEVVEFTKKRRAKGKSRAA
jgi:hypothetical protein